MLPGQTSYKAAHRRPKPGLEPTINKYLLRCKVLLAAPDTPMLPPPPDCAQITAATSNNELAMWYADKVLDLAAAIDSPTGVARAHLFRGHCFRQRGAWPDAYRCYVRAASVRTFASDRSENGLEELTALCKRKLKLAGRKVEGAS